MPRRMIHEHEAKAGWSHFIGNRAFALVMLGEKQEYVFILSHEEMGKLKLAIAEYDKNNEEKE